jgi:PE-PPE domain-containing protein
VLFLGTTAAALSTVLVFGHATDTTAGSPQVQLTAATIGIGGQGDPDAVNIPNKLSGNALPNGFTYIPVHYPAGFDIDNSVAAGVPVLDDAIRANSDQFLLVVGYSEGTIVAEDVRRRLDPADPDAPPTDGLLFVMIASPHVPNGGIFGRFPGLTIPFFVTLNGAAQPSPYDTTYVTNEYDPTADFPAYFNPLSLANTLVAIMYVHPDPYYDSVDYDPLTNTGTTPVLVKTVTNTAGGTDTYVFVPAEHLPLLAPPRQLFAAAGLTPLTEPVLGVVEPVLRLLVDMGYTDRANLNPEDRVQFSLITPPEKIVEAVAGVPGALGQGVANVTTGVGSLPTAIPAPLAATSSQINATSLAQASQDSLVDNKQPPGTEDSVPPQTSSASSVDPANSPVSPLGDQRPTLGKVTADGSKFTPNTFTKSASPHKDVLSQLADTLNGFFSPKKPAPSTPSSDLNDPAPSGSPSRGQSEGHPSNAA